MSIMIYFRKLHYNSFCLPLSIGFLSCSREINFDEFVGWAHCAHRSGTSIEAGFTERSFREISPNYIYRAMPPNP